MLTVITNHEEHLTQPFKTCHDILRDDIVNDDIVHDDIVHEDTEMEIPPSFKMKIFRKEVLGMVTKLHT